MMQGTSTDNGNYYVSLMARKFWANTINR